MTTPRGIRNNNFGNIRRTKDKWLGLCKEQTDPAFFQFTEPKWGYRALLRTLQNYRRRHNCKTIADFIKRWAPSNENDTAAYIRSVCKQLQVPESYVPDVSDKDVMCAFAAAISKVENGVDAIMSDIERGWELL
jgi:hypothetical protein